MVLEKIKAILSGQFDVEEDSITPETNLADDLGADSLDVVDLLMSIEDEFEVEIPTAKWRTSRPWARWWNTLRATPKAPGPF